jgi:hypothetical protein
MRERQAGGPDERLVGEGVKLQSPPRGHLLHHLGGGGGRVDIYSVEGCNWSGGREEKETLNPKP